MLFALAALLFFFVLVSDYLHAGSTALVLVEEYVLLVEELVGGALAVRRRRVLSRLPNVTHLPRRIGERAWRHGVDRIGKIVGVQLEARAPP